MLMKYKVLAPAIGVMLLLAGCATPLNRSPLEVQKIYTIKGMDQKALCSRAKEWMIYSLKEPDSIMESMGSEQGKVFSRGRLTLVAKAESYTASFNMTVECRKQQVRVTYDKVIGVGVEGPFIVLDDEENHLQAQAAQQLDDMNNQLLNYLQAPKKAAKDW